MSKVVNTYKSWNTEQHVHIEGRIRFAQVTAANAPPPPPFCFTFSCCIKQFEPNKVEIILMAADPRDFLLPFLSNFQT